MKILIGTPIHETKDKQIKGWLKNVTQLDYKADLLLVDTSKDKKYIEIVRQYCSENKIKNYHIEHLSINQEQGTDELTNRSRETIRQHVLDNNYDAWFSFECDNTAPANTLTILSQSMQAGNIDIICTLDRNQFSQHPLTNPNDDLGCTLISKHALQKRGFLLEHPDMPDCWHGLGAYFKKQIITDGGKYIEIAIDNTPPPQKYQKRNNLRLNLGCGDKYKKGYVNIDILDPCELKLDLTQPLPFPNNSINEIFSEGNTICLFSKKEWKALKKEMARVLKVGGKMQIIFIDFEYVLKSFLNDNFDKRWNYWRWLIFSAQKDKYDHSKNAFTLRKLITDLEEEGMVGFKQKQPPSPEYIHLICYKYKQ